MTQMGQEKAFIMGLNAEANTSRHQMQVLERYGATELEAEELRKIQQIKNELQEETVRVQINIIK